MRDVIGLLEAYGEHAEAAAHPVELDEIVRPIAFEDVIERRPAPPLTPLQSRPRWVVALVAALVGLALIGGIGLLIQPSVEEEPPVITQAPAPTVTTAPSTTVPVPETTLSDPAPTLPVVPTVPSTTVPSGAAGTFGDPFPSGPAGTFEDPFVRDRLVSPTAYSAPEIYPPATMGLRVVGVAHDGAVNVREGPGLTPVITTLESMGEVLSVGEGQELATTTWWKVDVDGTTGWVNASYLSSWWSGRYYLTSYVEHEYGGSPVAPTMAELGRLVAETLASKDYPSRIAMVSAPTVEEPGSATFDVVSDDGLGLRVVLEDREGQTGWRLRVTGTTDNGKFVLKSVDGQVLVHACHCWD